MIAEKEKVLFLCMNNSARSQMAEGLLQTIYGNRFEAFSAGVKPTKVNPYAIEVLKELGIDISNHISKSIEEYRDITFDYVITVCDIAKESCPFFPGNKVIHKSFKDPSENQKDVVETLQEFRTVRDEIKTWIEQIFKESE
jgi:arsenate reductase